MPYRRLPVSDIERLQALEAAASKAAVVNPANLAFSESTKTTLDTLLPQFRTEMQLRGSAIGAQVAATSALTAQRDRLRLWTSHFFQNFNLGVARGVFAAPNRTFYQLPASQESVPGMTSEADLLMWSQRVVDGEAARVAAGGTAALFPTAAEVGDERAAYVTLQADQSTKRDAADSEQEEVAALRESVDNLIRDIWDEVEFTFRKDAPPSLRAKSREYGVVYVSRPGESPENGGNGSGGPTFPFNSILTPEGVLVLWFQMIEGLSGVTNILVREGTEQFSTGVVLNPGQSQQLTWPNVAISGEIDEVALRDADNNVLATGVRDPDLPDPGP